MLGPRPMGDAEIGKDETTENLNRHLLQRVRRRAEAALEVAVAAVRRSRGVPELVQPDAVKRGRIAEAGERRHHHRVGRWPVVGLVAFEHSRDAEVADEGLGVLEALAFRQHRHRWGLVAVRLCDVEYREGAGEHRTAPTAVVIAAGTVLRLVAPGGHLLPQHHGGGLLAAAHLGPDGMPGAICSPQSLGVAGPGGCRPQHERIDAAVALAACDVGGTRGRRPVMVPRHAALPGAGLDGGGDLCCDAVVDVGARGRS